MKLTGKFYLGTRGHITTKLIAENVILYGITHALVDAACAGVIFANVASKSLDMKYLVLLIVLYNILAFGLQAPMGFIADNLKRPIETSVLGCLFVIFSLIVYEIPIIAICLAGIGNAFFHVGGGIVSLNLRPGKAAIPGIYVAPGALGLLIGTLTGKGGNFTPWPFVGLLIIAIVLIITTEGPKISYCIEEKVKYDKFQLVLFLILASIAMRALIGFMLNYSWKNDSKLLIAFTLAVVLGKAFGGILGDRFGWLKTTTAGLLLSAPILAFGGHYPYIVILGVFLFNLTMPVTLVAVANMFPGRAGFAFGLTTVALLIGSFPTFTELKPVICTNNKWLILGGIFLMAFMLYKGLGLYTKSNTSSYPIEGKNTTDLDG